MIINKNSWHYKIASGFGSEWAPQNLCPYVRRVLFRCLGYLGVICLACAVCWLAGLPIALNLFAWCGIALGPWSSLIPAITIGAIILPIIIGSIAGFAFSLVFGFSKLKNKIEDKAEERKAAGIEDNIVVAYVKAKHSKICPVLDFEAK